MKIEYLEKSGPGLIIGYDWERYGKHSDMNRNEEEQGWSEIGVKAIMEVHKEFNAPLTFFVQTKILNVSNLRNLLISVAKEDFVEIAQHSHSHLLVQPINTVKQTPVTVEEFMKDVRISQLKLRKIGINPVGFRAPLGYYKGFQNSEIVVRELKEMGLLYISSDARNCNHEFPAPWEDMNGNFRQPYLYIPYSLLEIPIQGWSDNVLKGMSRHTPIPDAGIEKEIEHHKKNLHFARKENLFYAPAYHPWSIGAKDPKASAIKEILSECQKLSMPVFSYIQIANLYMKK